MFGSLVIKKTSLTFDPNTLDPLVQDRGIEDFKFVIPLNVTGYSLLLRMRGARLRFTVNSEMCARLWRQFFYR